VGGHRLDLARVQGVVVGANVVEEGSHLGSQQARPPFDCREYAL
jgi:hypothetical protein